MRACNTEGGWLGVVGFFKRMTDSQLGAPLHEYPVCLLTSHSCLCTQLLRALFFHFPIAAIRLKSWREEVVGHTIMYSKVLNLHQPQKGLPSKCKSTCMGLSGCGPHSMVSPSLSDYSSGEPAVFAGVGESTPWLPVWRIVIHTKVSK